MMLIIVDQLIDIAIVVTMIIITVALVHLTLMESQRKEDTDTQEG